MHLPESTRLAILRGGAAVAVLLVGVAGAVYFIRTKPSPEIRPPAEPVLSVRFQTAEESEIRIELVTQGVVEPIRTVQLATEVGGTVVEVPSGRKAGNLVQKGDLLLRLDARDYQNTLDQALATVTQLEASQEMLQTNVEADRERKAILTRSLELARKEHQRLQALYADGETVSISAVETAEQAVNQTQTQWVQVDQALRLAVPREKELKSQLQAARAAVKRAERNVARCEIRAPFHGRITESMVEIDSYVQPGMPVFRVADDQSLEIPVSLPASDVRQWLPFASGSAGNEDPAWFPPLPPLPVEVRWAGDRDVHTWTGTLDRLVQLDATTRTVNAAVRLTGDQLRTSSAFPLTAGMFCEVRIQGKTLSNVFVLPRVAVTFDGKVYISDQSRLKTVPVEVVRSQKDQVMVRGGLQPGDQVVVTRLVAPLEGIRLKAVGDDDA
jgi:RND family efflux transporter MFP subunit